MKVHLDFNSYDCSISEIMKWQVKYKFSLLIEKLPHRFLLNGTANQDGHNYLKGASYQFEA
jgi:hypothetical protein